MQEIQGKLWELTKNLDSSDQKSNQYMEIGAEHKSPTKLNLNWNEQSTVPLIENFGMIEFFENVTPKHTKMRNQLRDMKEVSDFDQESSSDSFSRSNSSPPVGKKESFFPQSRNIELPQQLMTKQFSQLSGTSEESSIEIKGTQKNCQKSSKILLETSKVDRLNLMQGVNIKKIAESPYNRSIQGHRQIQTKQNIQEDTSQRKKMIIQSKIRLVQQEPNFQTHRHQSIRDRYYSRSSNTNQARSIQQQTNVLRNSNQEKNLLSSNGTINQSQKGFKSKLLKINSLVSSTKTTDSPTLSVASVKLNSPHTITPQLRQERISNFKKLFQNDNSLQQNPRYHLNKIYSSNKL